MSIAGFYKKLNYQYLLLVFTCALCLFYGTQTVAGAADPDFSVDHYVTDEARMLSPQERAEIEHLLKDFDQKTSNQLLVVTVPNLPAGESLESYSINLVDQVKAGTAQEDNGALLLIVRDQRSVRIEVGYGLEDELTDGRAGRIIRQVIAPAFQQGAYYEGISRALLTMIKWIDPHYLPAEVNAGLPSPDSRGGSGLGLLRMIILFFILIIFSSVSSRADRRRWSRRGYSQSSFGPVVFLPRGGRRGGPRGFGGFSGGGGFGGGGFSGGGGGFGGGGASGGW